MCVPKSVKNNVIHIRYDNTENAVKVTFNEISVYKNCLNRLYYGEIIIKIFKKHDEMLLKCFLTRNMTII